MNEELQGAVTEILNTAISAKDFILGELPDYINQLLLWHGVYNFTLFIAGIVFCLVWVYANYRQIKWVKANWDDIDEVLLIPNLIQLLLLFPLEDLINLQWLQIWLAPKVWLVEYVMNLTK